MQKLFNKILVPVDVAESSLELVDMAFDFAVKYNCPIHLLYVSPVSSPAAANLPDRAAFITQKKLEQSRQLEYMRQRVDLLSNNTVHAAGSVITGTWNQGVIDFVKENKFDLVLIGSKTRILKKGTMDLDPDHIAEQTNIPVITVPCNRRLTTLYSIVIPITDFLPVRRLMYGVYMALSLNTTIRLVGMENEKTKEKVHYYLDKANRLIKDNCDIKVEVETIVCNNIAEAVNNSAIHQSPGLVIVNPGMQTRTQGLLASLLGNIIQKYAAPPVLAINPV